MLIPWSFHPRNKMNGQNDILNDLESSVSSFESPISSWLYFGRSLGFVEYWPQLCPNFACFEFAVVVSLMVS
jgi:hypothetical protein